MAEKWKSIIKVSNWIKSIKAKLEPCRYPFMRDAKAFPKWLQLQISQLFFKTSIDK